MLWSDLLCHAKATGLADCGIVDAADSRRWPLFQKWLADGNAADMAWLNRYEEARRHPRFVFPQVQSLLIVALAADQPRRKNHQSPNSSPGQEKCGLFIDYATRVDYHHELRRRAGELTHILTKVIPDLKVRIVVDTAPLLEKEWAERAGLGRLGRNCLLLHPTLGSRFFLGAILLSKSTADLFEGTAPQEKELENSFSSCGSCRRCLDACPTHALLGNGTLDARKCLNYWSIEAPAMPVPDAIKNAWGRTLYGCDRCQKVCPHNHRETDYPPLALPLDTVTAMTELDFRHFWQETPVARIGLAGLKRNASLCRYGD
ncbi:MAG: tRNA epoxyqueuosine(34) reductase QueG [Planctomycetia bacterium]|nr:tRNA epoxyqueuosine(34) reductase QueG [Planctomycetia bacterium]